MRIDQKLDNIIENVDEIGNTTLEMYFEIW